LIIYLITNVVNGKIYVGQSVNSLRKRWGSHCYDAGQQSPWLLHRAIRKYGPECFKQEVIFETTNFADLDVAEEFYILLWNSNDPSIGYNMTKGGENHGYGYERKDVSAINKKRYWSINSREKLSKAHLGIQLSASHRNNISIALKGRKRKPLSEEHKRKLSIVGQSNKNCLGRKYSSETIQKMRDAKLRLL
jgi:group I intron endonuclease